MSEVALRQQKRVERVSFGEIKKRSVTGALALTSRTFILQLISFVGTFFLTIFLEPQTFGVFFVVSAVVVFFNYFSDIGLAAALIQKKEALTDSDLKTTFTIQQALVGVVVLLALISSTQVARFYNLSVEGLWLFRSFVFAFFLSSLKTIPSILLERKLDFNRLIVPQIVETILFYLVAIFLAGRGLGISSFTWAVLIRGISGLLVIYFISPWIPSFGFNKKVASRLLSFGLPFQTNSLLALLKDDLLTIYLGRILSFSQVGFIGWAKKWAEIPLRLLMDNIIKVTFPTFARIQTDKIRLRKGIEKTLFFLSLIIFPMIAGLLLIINPIIQIVPKYVKWEPALTAFYLYAISSLLASLSTPLTNALNAIGKIGITLRLMIMWTILTWVLTLFLVGKIGFNGVALAAALVSATVVFVIYIAKKYVDFSIFGNIFPALLSSTLMFVILVNLRGLLSNTYWQLLVFTATGVIIYAGTLLAFFRNKLVKEREEIISALKP